MSKSLLAAAIAIAAARTVAADEWFVEAHYPDHAALVRGAALFQHVIVDPERRVLRVDTDDDGIRMLEDAGLTVSIDAADTARLRAFETTLQDAIASRRPWFTDAGYPSIPGYACYRTVEGTYQTMDDLVAAHAGLAEIHDRPELAEDAELRDGLRHARAARDQPDDDRRRSEPPEDGRVRLDPRTRVHAGGTPDAHGRVAGQRLRHRSAGDLAGRPRRLPLRPPGQSGRAQEGRERHFLAQEHGYDKRRLRWYAR
jgi:hypothetical protein